MSLKSFFLFLLSVVPVISHRHGNLQTKCAGFEGNSLFVNSSAGQNSPTCGTKERPCHTISFAVSRAVDQGFSSVLINISSGIYKEADIIKLHCSRWKLQRISLVGERQDKQVAQVDFSLNIQSCKVSLVNLHWTSGTPVLHNVLLSNLTICQCTTQGTNISVVGSSSNILLQDSNISNSSGYRHGLPLLAVTSLPGYQNTLDIIHGNFLHNVGPLIFVENAYQATVINSLLEGNKALPGSKIITSQFSHLSISGTKFVRNFGTLLGAQHSGSLNVSGCVFQQNDVFAGSVFLMEGLTTAGVKDCIFQDSTSYNEGPVIRFEDSYSSASVGNCHFSCNKVNSSVFVSPVLPHGIHQVSCDNCTVDHDYPVHCSPGEFLASSILCKPCPIGSYSPGVVMNKSALQCASCPAGTYSSKTKSKICTPCAKDTFSSKAGSTSCVKCKNDFFTSKPGQASCSKLTVGFITLTVLVCLLIAVPLMMLLLLTTKTAHTENSSSYLRDDDDLPLLGKRIKPNWSIQNGDTDGQSLPGMSNLTL